MSGWSTAWVKVEGVTDWVSAESISHYSPTPSELSTQISVENNSKLVVTADLPVLSLNVGQQYRVLIRVDDTFGERIWQSVATFAGHSEDYDLGWGNLPSPKTVWRYNAFATVVTAEPPMRYQAIAMAATERAKAALRRKEQPINWKQVGF